MSHTPITRRDALGLLAALPFVARFAAQAGPARLRRVFVGMYHSLMLEPDGTLKGWSSGPTRNSAGELGQGHFDPVALDERASGLILLRVHPRLDPIRKDARYWPLVRRVGLESIAA